MSVIPDQAKSRLLKEYQNVPKLLEGPHLPLEKTNDAVHDIRVFDSLEKVHL